MRGIIDFLIETKILQIASDPRVMFAAGALFLISLVMRWRILALSLFGVAALLAVARYSRLAEGRTSLDGERPVNPDGGLKAKGHPVGATGAAMVYEMFLQLRGEAGKHQVDDAMIGLAHNVGASGGTVVVQVYGR